MRHKKFLFIVFFLALFIFQQVQASSQISPVIQQPSSAAILQSYNPPTQILVWVYHLDEFGHLTDENNPIPCNQNPYVLDFEYGCSQSPAYFYPYPTNPALVDVENDYLLDVISHEMPPQQYPNPEALSAQAITARSYAYYFEGTHFENSTNRQVFIPYAFEFFLQGTDILNDDQHPCGGTNSLTQPQQKACDAVLSTTGQYLALHDSGLPAKAEFSSDWGITTVSGDQPYLQSVYDPISTCATSSSQYSHGRGLNQRGANRWALGNKCPMASDGNEPWPVTWDGENGYKQILAHYYTGLDILNAGGGKVAPDDRWNLLQHNIPANHTVQYGAAISGVQLYLQNTSTSDWNGDDIEVGYHWGDQVWHIAGPLPSGPYPKGKEVWFTTDQIIASSPNCTNCTLHLDLRHKVTGQAPEAGWFSNGGWPDAQIAVTVEGPAATATFTPGSRGFYPNGIHVKYYNDVAPTQIFLEQPINWDTFTTLAAESDVQTINYDWGTTSPAAGVNPTFWSARYEGQLLVPQDGNYTFYLEQLDDGGRLYVDGNLLIDKWLVQGPHFYQANISLTAGQHSIKIEYAQGPGSQGSLAVLWELPSVFAKELIGATSAVTSTPGPTSTPVSGTPVNPPPTAVTSTPIPPTPVPTDPPYCDSCNSGCQPSSAQRFSSASEFYGTPTPYATAPTPTSSFSRVVEAADLATLLYRVRDEILIATPEGQRLTGLYYAYIPNIIQVFIAHPEVSDQGMELLDLFSPSLQALLDGNGDTVTITSAQVQQTQAFLDALILYANTELQQVIVNESEARPLESMVGMTMNQASDYLFDTVSPFVISIDQADANPTSAASVDFTVTFSEPVTGVDATDFALTTTGVSGAVTTNVSGSGNTYTVAVNTGSGNGTIRLDVVNNGTILDIASNPLSGGFTSGQIYTIDKTPPTVMSILRASTNPTNATSVNFTVNFSESVTGVDTSDFNLTTSRVSGATVSGVSGSGSIYAIIVNTGSGNGSIRLNVLNNRTIKDAALNPLGAGYTNGETYTVIKSTTFADVPLTNWANIYIERAYNAGITSGCSTIPLNYCPTSAVTRVQTAIFLLRGMHGSSYTPPVATGTRFTDVPLGSFGAAWIEQIVAEGITSGCTATTYCPNQAVTRAQMAIFLVRARHGIAFVPPTATGIFTDVPIGSFGANHIEQLVADGITSGCGSGLYCPNTVVNRDSMAVFMVKTFNLP